MRRWRMPREEQSRERRRRFATFSGRLALLDDRSLAALLPSAGPSGWGVSGTAVLDEHPVFVKRIPVTALEAAHRHSTKNRFQLPVFYNYGVGSAGFGAYRELATHVKNTPFDDALLAQLITDAGGFPSDRRPGAGS